MTEPLYTLAEAEQMLRDQRCARQMHQLVPVDGQCSRLRCSSCGRTFLLTPE